jgi:hypothetical protein
MYDPQATLPSSRNRTINVPVALIARASYSRFHPCRTATELVDASCPCVTGFLCCRHIEWTRASALRRLVDNNTGCRGRMLEGGRQ